MADHELITAQLEQLAGLLPPEAFDEVAGGLRDAYEAHLVCDSDPYRAANAAIAEFGDAETITAAFIHHSPWRRSALALLATGPVIGGLWAATLVTSGWAQPIPVLPRTLFGGALLTIVLALVAVTMTRRHYRSTRLASLAGAGGVVVLDAVMVTVVLALGTPIAWPLALAVSASIVRALSTLRTIPSLVPSGRRP